MNDYDKAMREHPRMKILLRAREMAFTCLRHSHPFAIHVLLPSPATRQQTNKRSPSHAAWAPYAPGESPTEERERERERPNHLYPGLFLKRAKEEEEMAAAGNSLFAVTFGLLRQ